MGNQQVKCPNCDGKGHLGLASHGIAGAVVGGLLLGPFGLLLGSAAGLKAAQCERCDGTGMVIDGQASQSEPSYQTPSGWHRRQGKTMTMYHGTSQSNARSIVANGFRPSTGGMLGAGVYVTADPEKAKRYGNTLITVEVKTGKTIADSRLAASLPRLVMPNIFVSFGPCNWQQICHPFRTRAHCRN